MKVRIKEIHLKVLDFDIEARPLGWYGGDFVHKEVTAIACQFIGTKKMHCWTLGREDTDTLLTEFVKLYNEADVVTGHYIRGFDLPTLNAALLERQLPMLADKLTQDTKLDLIKRSGISVSQENLGALLGLEKPKVQMDQASWRAANRLEHNGLRLLKNRVIADVEQHIELREELLRLGALGPPVLWTSDTSGRSGSYHA